jgi:Ferritin-like domain
MGGPDEAARLRRWTRARALRAAAGGGFLVVGAGALGGAGRLQTSAAAPSERQDAEVLNVFLLLERVQEAFYREAVRRGRLQGELLEFARTAGAQEAEHVRFLVERLRGGTGPAPRTNFSNVAESDESFRSVAIELEEATVGAYVGQGANLTREEVGQIARIVSVEARQAAWIRDLAGENPAPRAADPPQDPAGMLARLRDRGFLE